MLFFIDVHGGFSSRCSIGLVVVFSDIVSHMKTEHFASVALSPWFLNSPHM